MSETPSPRSAQQNAQLMDKCHVFLRMSLKHWEKTEKERLDLDVQRVSCSEEQGTAEELKQVWT